MTEKLKEKSKLRKRLINEKLFTNYEKLLEKYST